MGGDTGNWKSPAHSAPTTADGVLKENINEAIQKWQNGIFGGGNDPRKAAAASVNGNRVFAEDLGTAIQTYVKSLKINMLPRTKIISTAPIWPWTPITLGHNAIIFPADNHGYLDDFPVEVTEVEKSEAIGEAQYVKYRGAPTNKV